MFRKTVLTAAVLAGAALAFSSMSAHAAFLECSGTVDRGDPSVATAYDITGNVSPNAGCTILSPLDGNENDSPQPGFVNTEKFFGFEDWKFDGKEIEGDGSSLLSFSGGVLSGTFTYTGGSTSGTLMVVFKDGAGTNLVAYLLNIADLIGVTGTYSTPFINPPFDINATEGKEISHVSVYYRGAVTVPEPGTLALLGMGLVGFGVARRRRA